MAIIKVQLDTIFSSMNKLLMAVKDQFCSCCCCFHIKSFSWEESRLRRNRTGRTFSLLQIHQKNNRTVNKVYKTTSDRQHRTSGAQKSSPLSSNRGKKFCFSFFFFFCFSSSSFFLLSFLLLIFLSYFLLKSSNTPLLFLNFHFHLNITLQKKEEKKKKKKKRQRSSIFKLNSIYISKFWVFVSVFKYFISNSLTSMLNLLIFVYQYVI